MKLDEHKGNRLVYMYLFIGADGQELDKSINHQLAHSELWYKLTTQNNITNISNNSSEDTGNTSQDQTNKYPFWFQIITAFVF